MDEVQKSKIRLEHWIDHNLDHLRGYSVVAGLLEKCGFAESAKKIRKGIGLIEAANDEFQKALADLPESGDHHHHQEEPHAHAHSDDSGHGHHGHHHHEHHHDK